MAQRWAASNRLGTLNTSSKKDLGIQSSTVKLVLRNSSQYNEVSSSQEWQKDEETAEQSSGKRAKTWIFQQARGSSLREISKSSTWTMDCKRIT